MALPIPAANGTVFGTALHRLLELTDRELSPALPARAANVAASARLRSAAGLEASARSALESEPVRRAAEREHWLELPIMVPEAGTTVEGIIDLIYREDDGSLVISFQDRHQCEPGIAGGVLTAAGHIRRDDRPDTGEEVSELVLIFCRASGAKVLRRTRG